MISEAESHAGEAHRLRELADASQCRRATRVPGRAHARRAPGQAARGGGVDDRGPDHGAPPGNRGLGSRRYPGEDERFEEASRGLADAIYAQASAAQSSAQASGNGDGAVDDEVVEDADFEVIDEEEATKS